MNVQKQLGLLAHRADKIRSKADIRHKMTIHVVKMQPADAQLLHAADFFSQTHQVRTQHGGRNLNFSFAHYS